MYAESDLELDAWDRGAREDAATRRAERLRELRWEERPPERERFQFDPVLSQQERKRLQDESDKRDRYHRQGLDLETVKVLEPSDIHSVCDIDRRLSRPGRGNRTKSRGRGNVHSNPRISSRIVASVSGGSDTTNTISEDIGVPLSSVRREVSRLVASSVLARVREGRSIRYTIVDERGRS